MTVVVCHTWTHKAMCTGRYKRKIESYANLTVDSEFTERTMFIRQTYILLTGYEVGIKIDLIYVGSLQT